MDETRPLPTIFHLGKGGVGKSTVSALTALAAAAAGNKVRLISLDPAHNLGDLWQRPLGPKPSQVAPNLEVVEVDSAHWIRVYLKKIEERTRKTYHHFTALNLEQYFTLLRETPGLEEHALLEAWREQRRNTGPQVLLVVDLPPTALALRFFALPELTLKWLTSLTHLRHKLLQRREMLTRVRLGNREIERDPVLVSLEEMTREMEEARSQFRDHHLSRLRVVLTPDPLAQAETELILEKLQELGLPAEYLILNRASLTGSGESPNTDPPTVQIPQSPQPPVGQTALAELAQKLPRQLLS
jgi:arsenite-transporting ATPase